MMINVESLQHHTNAHKDNRPRRPETSLKTMACFQLRDKSTSSPARTEEFYRTLAAPTGTQAHAAGSLSTLIKSFYYEQVSKYQTTDVHGGNNTPA